MSETLPLPDSLPENVSSGVIGTCGRYDIHLCDDMRSFYFEHDTMGDERSVKYTIDDINAIIDVEESIPFSALQERRFAEAMRKFNPELNFDYLAENWRDAPKEN